MLVRRLATLIFGGVGLLIGCGSFSESEAPPGDVPVEGGADACGAGCAGDGSSPDVGPPVVGGCPSGMRGPAMVRVGDFCVDSTEVTVAQYRAFLDALPVGAIASQPAACTWNASFQPSYGFPASTAETEAGKTAAEIDRMPVNVVDWCDARAFCAWSGKRLCGRLGGGTLSLREASTAASEWYVACSRNDGRRFPYGSDFVDDACNDVGSNARQPTASNPKCAGGYDGLFDMSGNVAEWIDACEADADAGAAQCGAAGGNFEFPSGSVDCASSVTLPDGSSGFGRFPRGTAFHKIGIRCCATASGSP